MLTNPETLHCLVAEDEGMVAIHIEEMLSDLGHTVTLVSNLEAALAEASSGAFDCAILDVNLRGRRSFPVADALAARGIRFAFATGYGVDGVDARFEDTPVLEKPFSITELQGVLSSF